MPQAKTEVKTTTCYMCACRCGIRVHLRDGEIRYIDGNPEHPLNQGVICAKGASGIMKQHSPARLTQPLLRKAGAERGAGEFEPITWERAFSILTERLARIRATDPKKFALFTGRDQMQALTGLFARQFGTPNYAAHGGFCSVNMAAGMIYTIGGSFWEFGGPDLDRAKLFVMIGTAEDHHSNPLKIGDRASSSGRAGASSRSTRCAPATRPIADEWIPITPGTDGALLHGAAARADPHRPHRSRVPQALHQRAAAGGAGRGRARRACSPSIRIRPGPPGDGRKPHNKLVWDVPSQGVKAAYPEGIAEGCDPALEGHYALADGTRVAPSFQLLRERVASCTPEWAEAITGIPADTHPQARRGAGRHGAPAGFRAADRLDRRLGQAPRDDAGPAGGLPRDARLGGALERLPDDPRAGGADERARHDRCARRLPAQGAVPAPHRAELPRLQLARHDQAEHAAQRGAARLPGASRRARDPCRRLAGAHRPRLLVGAPALGARPDAQRHHATRRAAIRTASTRC